MKKYLIPNLLLTLLLLCSCPPVDQGIPAPPEDGASLPNVILIDDFNSYKTDTPPPAESWSIYYNTSYHFYHKDRANRGITVINYSASQKKVLNLMYDIFAQKYTYGEGSTGYAYAQKVFTAPKAGVLSFSYYHIGFNHTHPNSSWAPSYKLDFWTEYTDDIENKNTNILFSNTTAADTDPFQVYTVEIPAGQHYLTWRVKKNLSAGKEDEIYIDDIRFTYK